MFKAKNSSKKPEGNKQKLSSKTTLRNLGVGLEGQIHNLSFVKKTFNEHVNTNEKTLAALKDTKEKYEELFQNANDIIFTHDLKGNFTSLNKAALKIGGYSLKEALKMNISQVLAPEYLGVAKEMIRKKLKSGGKTVYEVEIISKKDKRIPLEVSTRLVKENGNPVGIQGIARDISLYKKTQKSLVGAKKKLANRVEKRTQELTQINHRLRESEENYRLITQASLDGIFQLDTNGNYVFVNRAFEKMYGFNKNELLGQRFSTTTPINRKKESQKLFKNILSGKEIKKETISQRKKGDQFPVSLSAAAIKKARKIVGVVGIVRDITEKKRVESDLEEERRKMEIIYRTTKEGITLYDREGRVVYINPALMKLFGFNKDRSIIGLKRTEIATHRKKYYKYPIERSDDVFETERRCLSGESVSNIFIKVHSKPVRYIEADYTPIKSKKGNILGFVGSFRDVTFQKSQSEKINKHLIEVERQKNRLEAVFSNVEEGVFVIDSKRRIIQANPACEIMSSLSEKEMIGKHYSEVFGCHDNRGNYYPEFDPISKVLAIKDSIPYDEHLHINAEEKERWVGVSYTPILEKNEKIAQIVGVVRDVTRIKELDRAKSEFVSVASHELRTPLTVINGYLSLLLGGDLGNLEGRESKVAYTAAINKVYNETKRLTKLVEELLNVTRIEEGRLRLTLRKVSIVDIVSEVVSEFRTLTQGKDIYLELGDNLPAGRKIYVLGDKYKLKEVLVNLLDNAVKFTDPGGKVTIKCLAKEGQILIQVKDTGSGISPVMLPHVFDKFQQVTSPYIKENKGSGLGLFIVKSLVEMHNGGVAVESRQGKGSVFSFKLPIIAQE